MKTQTNEQMTKSGLLGKLPRAISRSAMVACALLSVVAMVAPAGAQNPPPGWIFELAPYWEPGFDRLSTFCD